jgi:hypothetical protein
MNPTREEPHDIINIILMLSTKEKVVDSRDRIMYYDSICGAHYSINCG